MNIYFLKFRIYKIIVLPETIALLKEKLCCPPISINLMNRNLFHENKAMQLINTNVVGP